MKLFYSSCSLFWTDLLASYSDTPSYHHDLSWLYIMNMSHSSSGGSWYHPHYVTSWAGRFTRWGRKPLNQAILGHIWALWSSTGSASCHSFLSSSSEFVSFSSPSLPVSLPAKISSQSLWAVELFFFFTHIAGGGVWTHRVQWRAIYLLCPSPTVQVWGHRV